MAVKSVIEVDVHDEAFKNFAKLFEKYQSLLKDTPKAWAAAGAEAAATAEGTALTAESLVAALLAHQKIADVASKARADESKKARENADVLKRNEVNWSKIASSGRSIARSTLDVTRNVVKWGSILGAGILGLGAGGIFGLDALASGAGSRRRAAQGFGVGIGEKQAFETNYSRVVDPDAFLGGVNNALTNASQRYSLYGAGLGEGDLRGKDTVQVATTLIPLLKKLADRTPDALLEQTLQARGLSNLGITAQDLQRLKRTSNGELGEFSRDFSKNKRELDLRDDVAKKWQDLDVRLRTAGRTIEAVFIRGLTPLTKPLEHFSEHLTTAIAAFLKNPNLGQDIEDFGQGIEDAAKYMASPKFKQDVKDFSSNVEALGRKIVDGLRLLGVIPDPNATDKPSLGDRARGGAVGAGVGAIGGGIVGGILGGPAGAAVGARVGIWAGGAAGAVLPNGVRLLGERAHPVGSPNWSNPGNIRWPGTSKFAQFDSAESGIRAVGRQLRLYENRDKLDTISKIIAKYAPAKDHNNVEAYIKDLEGRTKFGRNQHLDFSDPNVLAAVVNAILRHENQSRGKTNYTPQAIVKILNATGGNTIVQTSALAQ